MIVAKLITQSQWEALKQKALPINVNDKHYCIKYINTGGTTLVYEIEGAIAPKVVESAKFNANRPTAAPPSVLPRKIEGQTKRAETAPSARIKAPSVAAVKSIKKDVSTFTPKCITGEIKPTQPVIQVTVAPTPTVIEVIQSELNPPPSVKTRGVNKKDLKIGDKLMNTVTGVKLSIKTTNDINLIKFPLNWKLISTTIQIASA
jgi:hypothetical protein